jgi:hypothetical protein
MTWRRAVVMILVIAWLGLAGAAMWAWMGYVRP